MPELRKGQFELCAFCPDLCVDRCPVVLATGSNTLSPCSKMTQGWLLEHGHAKPTADLARAVYACMGCLGCHEACRHHVDVETSLFALRAELVGAGVSPFPKSLFETATSDLVEAQDALVPAEYFVPEAQAVFFFGCDALLKSPRVVTDVLSVFKRLGIEFVGASRDAALCCGYPLHAGGYADAFADRARRVVAALRRYRMVVVLSPCCAHTMRSLFAVAGVDEVPRVTLALDLIAPLVLRTAKPPLKRRIAYHDSCHLGRHLGRYDVPRQVLEHINGERPIELRRNRAEAPCCGSAGGFERTHPVHARGAARAVTDMAADAGAEWLVTVGLPCSDHLGAATDRRVKVFEIVSVVDRWLRAK